MLGVTVRVRLGLGLELSFDHNNLLTPTLKLDTAEPNAKNSVLEKPPTVIPEA